MPPVRSRNKRPSRTDKDGLFTRVNAMQLMHFMHPLHESHESHGRARASEARGGPRRILRAFTGLHRGLAGGSSSVFRTNRLALCPLGVGGRAEPQECSGLGAKSLTDTQRQLCSLLLLGR